MGAALAIPEIIGGATEIGELISGIAAGATEIATGSATVTNTIGVVAARITRELLDAAAEGSLEAIDKLDILKKIVRDVASGIISSYAGEAMIEELGLDKQKEKTPAHKKGVSIAKGINELLQYTKFHLTNFTNEATVQKTIAEGIESITDLDSKNIIKSWIADNDISKTYNDTFEEFKKVYTGELVLLDKQIQDEAGDIIAVEPTNIPMDNFKNIRLFEMDGYAVNPIADLKYLARLFNFYGDRLKGDILQEFLNINIRSLFVQELTGNTSLESLKTKDLMNRKTIYGDLDIESIRDLMEHKPEPTSNNQLLKLFLSIPVYQ